MAEEENNQNEYVADESNKETENNTTGSNDTNNTDTTDSGDSDTTDSKGGEEENEKLKEDLKRAKENGVDVEEFERTRKALEKANKEAAQRRKKLEEWENLGVDPDKVQEMIKQRDEEERKKAEEEGRYQELIEKMRNETKEKEEKAEQRVQEMQEKLNNQILEKEINSAISSKDGIADLLKGKVKENVKLEETDDGYEIQVLDEYGTPMKDSNGNNISVGDYVETLKEHPTYSYAFKAPKVSGAGSKGSDSTSSGSADSGVPNVKKSKMGEREKRDFVREHGFKAYQNLPE